MAEIAVVYSDELLYPFSFDPEHYQAARTSAFSDLKESTDRSVRDFFDEIEEKRSKGHLEAPTDVFDLTDSLGGLLGDVAPGDYIGSAKKRGLAGDLVVSRLRSYLQEVAVVPERTEGYAPLLSTEYIVLRARHRTSGSWLLPFLLSDRVQTVLQYTQTGSNHPRFSSRLLLDMPIPNEVLAMREHLSDMVDEAVRVYENSRLAYPEAETEMLGRMEFEDVGQGAEELWYAKDVDCVYAMRRMDAEFFQPKHQRMRKRLLGKGAMRIGDFCPMPGRGIQPKYVEDGDVVVIDSKAVRALGVSPSRGDRTSWALYKNDGAARAQIRLGDVVLNSTGLGTLGRAACFQLDEAAVADNHVTVVRPDKDVCWPTYLSLFLNSPAGVSQSERYQSGSSGQLEIYPQHIVEFLVFVPRNADGTVDMEWQKRLGEKAASTGRARIEARERIEKARRLVEEAVLR